MRRGFEMDAIFEEIQRRNRRAIGERWNDRGRRAEELAGQACQVLVDRGFIGGWEAADAELNDNGIDIIAWDPGEVGERPKFLLDVKSSGKAVLLAFERDPDRGWIETVVIDPGLGVEKAAEGLMEVIEKMRRLYAGKGGAR